MAGFIIRKGYNEDDVILAELQSTAVAIGDLVYRPVGSRFWSKEYAVDGTGIEHWHLKGVCTEAVATAIDSTIKILLVHPGQLWEVESANNSNVAHNGDRQTLTDRNTVNNTGTDVTTEQAIVIQEGWIGAASDKRILVRFTSSDGIDPDAA